MNNSIKLSPKHGLNPTVPVCFFCGKTKNEVAILGKINKQDDEAPSHMILDYEPCDECKKQMARGITLIGVTDKPVSKNQPPISKDETGEHYPTGDWCVVTEDCAKRLFTDDILNDVLRVRKLCLPNEILHAALNSDSDDDNI